MPSKASARVFLYKSNSWVNLILHTNITQVGQQGRVLLPLKFMSGFPLYFHL